MNNSGLILRLLLFGVAVASPGHSSVQAHIVEGVENLKFIGYAAPFGSNGTTTYSDVWADGDYAYLGSLESGVSIIDVGGPGNLAVPVGTFVPATTQQFYDIKAQGSYGYFSSLNGGGTFVVDASNPAAPFQVSQIDSTIGGHDNVRNVAIDGDYLYQIDDTSASIHVFDISLPIQPTFVRTLNTGDSVGIFDATVIGDRLYASGLGGTSGEGAVYVYDVSNPGVSPPLLGQVASGANTSSAWPTSNADYLTVTHREVGGALGIWDISDLSQPSFVTSADASDLGISSYSISEVVVLDDIVYAAWWEAGVQVLDLDNDLINNGVQLIGQHDTSSDSSPLDGFVGNQSVFPLLGHGKVLLSDTKWGFFVVSAECVLPALPNNGDFDDDGNIDGNDFLMWQQGAGILSGAGGTDGDADADGDVDEDDLLIWESNFGTSMGLSAAHLETVPEPASIMIASAVFMSVVVFFRAPRTALFSAQRQGTVMRPSDPLNESVAF